MYLILILYFINIVLHNTLYSKHLCIFLLSTYIEKYILTISIFYKALSELIKKSAYLQFVLFSLDAGSVSYKKKN